MSEDFFAVPAETSKIKGEIVYSYFKFWASVLRVVSKKNMRDWKLGYLDLYAGPGKYEDGTDSTPLKILQFIINDEELREKMVVIFNDKDNIKELEKNVLALPGYNKDKPFIRFESFTVEKNLAEAFEDFNLIPSFIFLDPFGLKGLSRSLFKNLSTNWGCDLITFFNFSFINRSVSNDIMDSYINDIFGEDRAKDLRDKIDSFSPEERRNEILGAYIEMLKDNGWPHVLTFMLRKSGNQIYYLVFATSKLLAFKEMKRCLQGFANEITMNKLCFYTYDMSLQNTFAELNIVPVEELQDHLIKNYKEKEMSLPELVDIDCKNTPFIEKDYRKALRNLEEENSLEILTSEKKRRAKTFPDHVRFKISNGKSDGK